MSLRYLVHHKPICRKEGPRESETVCTSTVRVSRPWSTSCGGSLRRRNDQLRRWGALASRVGSAVATPCEQHHPQGTRRHRATDAGGHLPARRRSSGWKARRLRMWRPIAAIGSRMNQNGSGSYVSASVRRARMYCNRCNSSGLCVPSRLSWPQASRAAAYP